MTTFPGSTTFAALGGGPTPLPTRTELAMQQRESGPGLGRGFQAAVYSESPLSWILQSIDRARIENDPEYGGLGSLPDAVVDSITEGLPADYIDDLAGARSLDELYLRAGQLHELVRSRQQLSQMGAAGVGLVLAANVLDPVAIGVGVASGGLGTAAVWSTRASRLQGAVRAGLIAAPFEAALEAPRVVQDPDATNYDFVWAAAGGAGFGGIAGFVEASRLRRAAGRTRAMVEALDQRELGLTAMGAAGAGDFRPVPISQMLRDARAVLNEKGLRKAERELSEESLSEFRDKMVGMLGLDEADARDLLDAPLDEAFERMGPAAEAFDDQAAEVIRTQQAAQRAMDAVEDTRAGTGAGDGGAGDAGDIPPLAPDDGTPRGERLATDLFFGVDGEKINPGKATLKGVRFGLLKDLSASDSPTVRRLAHAMIPNVLRTSDGRAQNVTAFAWKERTRNAALADYMPRVNSALRAYRRAVGKRVSRDEFSRSLATFVRNPDLKKTGNAAYDALIDAGQAARETLRRIGAVAKRHDVPGSDAFDLDDAYLPRLPQADRFRAAEASFGTESVEQALAEAIVRGSDGVEPADAARIAKGYLKVVRRLDLYTDHHAAGVFNGSTEGLEAAIREGAPELGDEQIADILYNLRADRDGATPSRFKHRVRLDENYVHTFDNQQRFAIADLFEDDVDHIIESYADSVIGAAAAAEVYRAVGRTVDPTRRFTSLQQLRPALERELREAGADQASGEELVKMLEFADKRLRGIPIEADTLGSRVSRVLTSMTYLVRAGGFGLAQMPEAGAVLAEGGVRNVINGVPALASLYRRGANGQLDSDLARELEAVLGTGAQRLLYRPASRRDTLGGVTLLERGSGLDRALRQGQFVMSDLSGLNFTQPLLERMIGVSMLNKFATIAADGRIPSKKRLSALGMDEAEATMIADAFRSEIARGNTVVERGPFGGRRVTKWGVEQWENTRAAAALINAIDHASRRVVQRNDIGSMRPWMSNKYGRIITQFQSFVIGAWEKQTLHTVQHFDGVAMNRVLFSSFIGGLVYYLQTHAQAVGMEGDAREKFLADRLGEDGGQWTRVAAAAAQRSGWASFVPQLADYASVTLGFDAPFNARNSMLSVRQSLPIVGVNPTSQLFSDASRAVGGVADTVRGDPFDQSDARALFNLVPGRTMLGFSNVLKAIETRLPEPER